MSIALFYLALLFLTLPRNTRGFNEIQMDMDEYRRIYSWVRICGWFDDCDTVMWMFKASHVMYLQIIICILTLQIAMEWF